MSAFSSRGSKPPSRVSLQRAHKLGIRTSRVSSWSRSNSFTYAVRASIILIFIIVGHAIISFTIILSQIDMFGEPLVYNSSISSSSPAVEELMSKHELCSTRERNKEWRYQLKNHLQQHQKEEEESSLWLDQRTSFAIVLTVNNGFFDFFMNWLNHFNTNVATANSNKQHPDNNLLEQAILLIIIAEDPSIHKRLNDMTQSKGYSTIILPGYKTAEESETDQAEDYDSYAYKSLVSTRATHLLDLICSLEDNANSDSGNDDDTTDKNEDEGRSEETMQSKSILDDMLILYTDTDTVWLKNPFPYIQSKMGLNPMVTNHTKRIGGPSSSSRYEILAAIDNDEYWSVSPYYCTGLVILQQTPSVLAFLSKWEKELKSNPQLNQPIFNTVLRSKELPPIRHGGLDESKFPSGRLYFDEWVKEGREEEKQKKKEVVFVHNNFIVGHDAKKERFEKHGLWIDHIPKRKRGLRSMIFG